MDGNIMPHVQGISRKSLVTSHVFELPEGANDKDPNLSGIAT
jgi:hypothetical protein